MRQGQQSRLNTVPTVPLCNNGLQVTATQILRLCIFFGILSHIHKMGRNAYINFYIWYFNEHRGQAPVTTIAKRAGIEWRKMTPQEKDRFIERKFHLKGSVPLNVQKNFHRPHKIKYTKSSPSSKRLPEGKHLRSIPKRKVSKLLVFIT